MGSAFAQALQLIVTGDPMLLQIIGVTLRMSLTSSATALVLGAPWGASARCAFCIFSIRSRA